MEKVAMNIFGIGFSLIIFASKVTANFTTNPEKTTVTPVNEPTTVDFCQKFKGNVRHSSPGDVTISFIVGPQALAGVEFVAEHLNENRHVLLDNITIGYRLHTIDRHSSPAQLAASLANEVHYQKHCMKNALGIFIDHATPPPLTTTPHPIWRMPSTTKLVMSKLNKLLASFPVASTNVSFEILTQSIDVYTDFMEAAKREHLCFVNNKRQAENIVLILGNDAELLPDQSNDTLIVVPFGRDDVFVSELPNNTFVATEHSLPVANAKNSSNLLPTHLINAATIFERILDTLDADLDCVANETCAQLFGSIEDWNLNVETDSVVKIFELLALEQVTSVLTYDLVQKRTLRTSDNGSLVQLNVVSSVNLVSSEAPLPFKTPKRWRLDDVFYCHDNVMPKESFAQTAAGYWTIKSEMWIAVALTIASLGVIFCFLIFIFIMVRVVKKDVLEGNPNNSVALILTLILQFASILPFAMEYRFDLPDNQYTSEMTEAASNTLCSLKIFSIALAYSVTFSLLISRGLMLASVGSEGGFLSHVNGYLQSVLCLFSVLVQVGLSTQLLIMMQTNIKNLSCQSIYYGNWFWSLVAYDGLLLTVLIFLSPFIFRSKRNYQEGILIVVAALLCLVVWTIWIPLSMVSSYWRDLAVPFGMQGTAWAILVGILLPRCFLIIRGIARSEFAQALPSLTSLAFASQQNQYMSDQSVYDCVNSATIRRQAPASSEQSTSTTPDDEYDNVSLSPGEVPTLPLRSSRDSQLFFNSQRRPSQQEPLQHHPKVDGYTGQAYHSPSVRNSRALMISHSDGSDQMLDAYRTPSVNKMTRF